MSQENDRTPKAVTFIGRLARVGMIAGVYFLFAEIGHAVSFPGDFATFWLPSGVAQAAYLSTPRRNWLHVVLATLAANLISDTCFHGKTIPVSFGFWSANTVESMSAVWLIRTFFPQEFKLTSVERVLKFLLLPCVCSTAVGATLGAGIVSIAFDAEYFATWRIWWSGDFIGMVITFPFLWSVIGWFRERGAGQFSRPQLPPQGDRLSFICLLALLLALTHYVFGVQNQRLAYVVFPVLLWLVVKFDMVGASTGLFAMAIVAVANTAVGNGLFGEIASLPTRAWVLQIFLFVSAITFLTLAAVIRERKDAERNLRKSRFTIDKSSDAVFWIREDGAFSYANEKAAEYLGYSTAELCTMTVADINPDYPIEAWPAHWRETKDSGGLAFESTHRRKDGTTYDCDLQKSFVRFENEEMIVASVRDITAVKANRRSLYRTQTALDTAADAVLWVNPAGGIIYANQEASRRLQYQNSELLGLTVADINPDLDSSDRFRNEFWPRIRNQEQLTLIMRHQRKDGSVFPVEILTHYIEFEGEEFVCSFIRDITERVRQESLFRAVVESAATGIVMVDGGGSIVVANPEAGRQFGYAPGALIGKSIETLVPEQVRDSHQQLRQEYSESPRKRSMAAGNVLAAVRKDGTPFWVEIGLTPVVQEDETYVLSIIVDVTLREEARKELVTTRAKLQHAITGGNVGLWDWHIKTGKVEFSDEWHRQLGETPGTLTEFNDWEVRLHLDDVARAKEIVERTLSERLETYQSTFRMRHADGSYRWILAQAKLYCDEHGAPERMVGSHTDVTELEETRSKLQAYLTLVGTTDGGWNWDLSTDTVDFSPRFRELLGFTSKDKESLPDSASAFYERLHPDDVELFKGQIQDHLQSRDALQGEYRLRRKDGSYRWFRIRGNTTRNSKGEPRRMAGSIYDVTDRKSVELKLVESNADLAQFAYVASHDLQEPLRAIGGFCQLLEKRYSDKLDERGRSYIQNAVEGAGRLTELIQDLLEFSMAGRDERPLTPLRLNDVVAAAISQVSAGVEESGARIEVDELPEVVGDTRMLTQLFQNLLGNAIKFRRPDIPLTIQVYATKSGSFWDVSVEDNGIGVEPSYTEQIFNIFKRLHRREQISGTGIGLAICKRIVDRHRGRIGVSSVFGEGSTFTVSLPAKE